MQKLLLLLFVLFINSIGHPQSVEDDNYISPAVNKLKLHLAEKHINQEKIFWDDLISAGTPLIEDFPGDSSYKLVTFLWKDTDADTVKAIAVKLWSRVFFSNQQYLDKCRLQKIPGSHTWFKTFKFRNDALFSYQFLINDKMKAIVGFNGEDWKLTVSKLTVDPYNKKRFSSIDGESSYLELDSTGNNKNYFTKKRDVEEGLITHLTFKSTLLQNERNIWIYTPAGFNQNKKYPLYLFLDGHENGISDGMPTATILDNLISEKKIPPGIAVLVGNVNGAVRVKEYFYNDNFASFIADELLPSLKIKYKLEENPKYNLISGSSLGGNASLFVAVRHPEIFGNVIAQSGGFMYGKENTQPITHPELFMEDGFPEYEWLTQYIAASKNISLKVRIDVGLLEDINWVVPMPRFGYPTLLVGNRHLRDVLLAKGWAVFYNEYNGAHESLNWQKYLGQGMIDLLGTNK